MSKNRGHCPLKVGLQDIGVKMRDINFLKLGYWDIGPPTAGPYYLIIFVDLFLHFLRIQNRESILNGITFRQCLDNNVCPLGITRKENWPHSTFSQVVRIWRICFNSLMVELSSRLDFVLIGIDPNNLLSVTSLRSFFQHPTGQFSFTTLLLKINPFFLTLNPVYKAFAARAT